MKSLEQIFAEILSKRLEEKVNPEYIYMMNPLPNGWEIEYDNARYEISCREVLDVFFNV